MTTIERNGTHFVVDETGSVVAGPFTTNAAAWRWIDRREGEPISRSEAVSDWITQQILERH